MNFNFDFESAFNAARAKTKNASAVQSIVSSEDIVKGMNTYFRYYQKDMWKCIEESIASDKAIDHKLMFKSGTGTGKTEVFKFISPYIYVFTVILYYSFIFFKSFLLILGIY